MSLEKECLLFTPECREKKLTKGVLRFFYFTWLYLHLINLIWTKLTYKSQRKIAGMLPPNTVFSVLAHLLILPMLFITIKSPNLAHQHWEGKKTANLSVPTILTETVRLKQIYLQKVDVNRLLLGWKQIMT